MKVQKIEEFYAISVSRAATLDTISACAEDANRLIDDAVARFGLQVVGPMVFQYTNMSHEIGATFDLTIGLPIANAEEYEGDLVITQFPSLNAVVCHYVGPLNDLSSKGYDPMLKFIKQNDLQMLDDCREVYHRWLGPNAETNDIELQIGVE